jgi:hypothetical protein
VNSLRKTSEDGGRATATTAFVFALFHLRDTDQFDKGIPDEAVRGRDRPSNGRWMMCGCHT